MIAVGLAVRLLPWARVFTADGVLLMADGDTYYHALRAERLAADWPHVPWFDPWMNYPDGAEIPWPPLLDQGIATASVLTGPPTPEHVAGVAALFPPFLGALLVGAAAVLAGLLLAGGVRWDAALLVALLPAAVRQSFVGRPDHHVLEALLSTLAYLAYLAGVRPGRGGSAWPALLGLALALGFWNWPGSALYLLVLSAHVAALHACAPAGDPAPGRAARLLAGGALVAGVLLSASLALWGPPGALRSARLTPISGLSVGVCAWTAASAALVAATRRRAPSAGPLGRAVSLAAAALAPAAVVLALPARLRGGLEHGLTAVGASSAWYESIGEFWPLLFSGRQPWTLELYLAALAYGLAPLLLLPAAWLLVRAWRADPARRAELTFLAVWGGATIALALARRRFEGYAALPVAIGAAWVVGEAAAAAGRRLGWRTAWTPIARVAALVLLVGPGLPLVLGGAVAEAPAGAAEKFPLLRALRDIPPPPGREAVLAAWAEGHEIQWLARKPVISTPFGTDIDPRSMHDEAAFLHELDPSAADALLRRRRVGFLLLQNPVREVATLHAFAPESRQLAIEEKGISTGSRYAFYPEFFDLIGCRLFFFDGGSGSGEAPGLGGYRLLGESAAATEVLGLRAQQYKLFGVVPGAVLQIRGAAPGTPVAASVAVRTNVGRRFSWATRAVASPSGEAVLRVPFASGWNGMVLAGPYAVRAGGASREVLVGEAQVAGGQPVAVELGGR